MRIDSEELGMHALIELVGVNFHPAEITARPVGVVHHLAMTANQLVTIHRD